MTARPILCDAVGPEHIVYLIGHSSDKHSVGIVNLHDCMVSGRHPKTSRSVVTQQEASRQEIGCMSSSNISQFDHR